MQQNRNPDETASRGTRIYTFSQDVALRYTSVSGPMFGRGRDEIIGCTDAEIAPEGAGELMTKLKREALELGRAAGGEVRIVNGATPQWFDLQVEPLRGAGGEIVGLTGTAVDITEHKNNEAHLRMLMRELTHRSKNLLAVIQAMARQTARHSESIDAFLDQFGARLQALATSHDLLVQEGWHGAMLGDLVRRQLGGYLDRDDDRVSVSGSDVVLKPEAAQSLGLALHELATNAARYGALSVAKGSVSVAWRRLPPEDGYGVELTWVEEGGPAVTAPIRRGFGSAVIERNLARALDAEVEWTFAPGGLRCRIQFPVTQLVLGAAEGRHDGDTA